MSRFRKALTLFDDYYDMMSDRVRMEAYRRAIRRAVRPGDVVCDLGAGLGILSFLALQAGASKVYAIEKMDSVNLARSVAALNGFADRIVFINENSKDVELPERVDVLVSETLGSFALEENTLDFTVDARRRFLKEGGRMVPESVRLFLVPVEDAEVYGKMTFWRDVCGVDFTPARRELTRRLMIVDIAEENFLAAPLLYDAIDLRTVDCVSVEKRLTFTFERRGEVHGLAGWFDTVLTDDITIDTSPSSPPTHWRQAFFPIEEPVVVVRGDYMEVDFRVGPKTDRSDDTLISYDYFCSQLSREYRERNVGRNDPCPCGSGLKFKKCCGR
ncbi:MAG TPA: hypothetical protein ENJ37_06010 [Deltaproteobacteria bacterium]|nr:hypothetical protein [Deltaproteobacteria bacterium]